MDDRVLNDEIELLKRELTREQLAHLETEGIAEKITLELFNTNTQLQTIFDITKDGIAIIDLETNFLFFNKAYLLMTGFTKEELLTKSCAGLSSKEDLHKAEKVVKEVIEKGFVENFEKTCIVKNNKRMAVNMSFAMMPDNKRILVATKDITEQKKKEKMIQDYIKLVDMSVITSSTDLEGNITYVSDAFCNTSGYSKDELIGQNHKIVRHPDMEDSVYSELWNTIKLDMVWVGEIKNKKKDGSAYWVQASISPTYDEYGKKVGYTAVRQDITDKKLLEQISITDALTTIYNRRYFNETFPKVINSAKRKNELVSFIILDIDHFKQYNDTYGHQKGDEVLTKVAEAMKGSLHRGDDYCFRLGGEEFGVLFKVDAKEKALEFANLIKTNIENLSIEHSGNSASSYITVSIGLICKNANDISHEDEVYKEADKALYVAKRNGRNRVFFE